MVESHSRILFCNERVINSYIRINITNRRLSEKRHIKYQKSGQTMASEVRTVVTVLTSLLFIALFFFRVGLPSYISLDGSSRHGTAETNPTANHEFTGSIPGLAHL